MNTRTYTHACKHEHLRTHTHMNTHAHTNTHAHMNTHKHTHTHTHTHPARWHTPRHLVTYLEIGCNCVITHTNSCKPLS